MGQLEIPQVVSFFIVAFRGTDSNRLVPGKVRAIGFRLLETVPEMVPEVPESQRGIIIGVPRTSENLSPP